jgi:flagellar assembly factor FliW
MTITFPTGLIGFPCAKRFALVEWGGEDSPFRLLRSLDDDGLAFVVVPPELFFPDYEPELEVGDDDVVLVIVTVPDRAQDATANLLGPVVIDTRTGVASQAVLAPERWPSRRPLVA